MFKFPINFDIMLKGEGCQVRAEIVVLNTLVYASRCLSLFLAASRDD
jgi:hypothetical protein